MRQRMQAKQLRQGRARLFLRPCLNPPLHVSDSPTPPNPFLSHREAAAFGESHYRSSSSVMVAGVSLTTGAGASALAGASTSDTSKSFRVTLLPANVLI